MEYRTFVASVVDISGLIGFKISDSSRPGVYFLSKVNAYLIQGMKLEVGGELRIHEIGPGACAFERTTGGQLYSVVYSMSELKEHIEYFQRFPKSDISENQFAFERFTRIEKQMRNEGLRG